MIRENRRNIEAIGMTFIGDGDPIDLL